MRGDAQVELKALSGGRTPQCSHQGVRLRRTLQRSYKFVKRFTGAFARYSRSMFAILFALKRIVAGLKERAVSRPQQFIFSRTHFAGQHVGQVIARLISASYYSSCAILLLSSTPSACSGKKTSRAMELRISDRPINWHAKLLEFSLRLDQNRDVLVGILP